MKLRRGLLCTLLVAMVAPLPGAAAAQPGTDEPGLVGIDAPLVWLEGAFGRVAGGSVDEPAAAPPDGTALDTFVRSAPLSMEAAVPFEDLISVNVIAHAPGEHDPEEMLSDGATVFAGPEAVGESVIVATLETEPFGTTEHAWLVNVPDREWTPEALLEVTAPGVELISDAGIVPGVPGDGCYLILCADMGRMPPVDSLEPLRVSVGESLALRTDDGSGLAGWTGHLTPLDGTQIDGIEGLGALTDTVESMVTLTGLEVPAKGEWLLEVRADFDRERGYQWQVFRLDAR